MKIYVLVFLFCALVGAVFTSLKVTADPQSYRLVPVATDNKRCTVYRFEASTTISYFAVCESGTPAKVD